MDNSFKILESMTTTMEIRLRGEFLYSCSLMESQLIRILLHARAFLLEEPPINLRKSGLEVKLKRVIKAVKNKDIQLYNANKETFDYLLSKVELRNTMAHSKFDWEGNNFMQFTAWNIVEAEDEEKTQSHAPFQYQTRDIIKDSDGIMEAYNALVLVANLFENDFLTGMVERMSIK